MRDVVAPMYDRAYSALITDLIDRGMLDDTLVCNLAEFGRTPRVKPGRRAGPLAAVLDDVFRRRPGCRAGGRSVPATRSAPTPPNARRARRTSVGTIFHSLGLDLHTELPGPAGRPFPLVDFGTKPLYELF